MLNLSSRVLCTSITAVSAFDLGALNLMSICMIPMTDGDDPYLGRARCIREFFVIRMDLAKVRSCCDTFRMHHTSGFALPILNQYGEARDRRSTYDP